MRTIQGYQNKKKYIRPLPLQKQAIQRWNAKEKLVYNELLLHYKSDYRTIAREMHRTFPDKIYQPMLIRKLYLNTIPAKKFTYEELDKIFKIYIKFLVLHKRHIWRVLNKIIQKSQNQAQILKQKFHNFNKYLIRKLNFFYGNQLTQYQYDNRIQMMTMAQFNVIYYLGNMTPNPQESTDKLFIEFCIGCRKFYQLVQAWIDLRLIYMEEPLDLISPQKRGVIPQISEEEFQQMMEIILCLDTLHRVIFEINPYNFIEDIQVNPVIELDETLIAKKILSKGYGEIYQPRQRLYGVGLKQKIEKYIFPLMDDDHMNTILKSDTVLFLLPHMTLLAREWITQTIY